MNKSELLQYIGNLSQAGGSRHYTLNEGWGRGLRATDINTGGGLQYTILPDRGMDISSATFKGINLVYTTCNGETNPAFYETEGIGWLHTFGGGLLTTCGLTHFGPPCEDGGEKLGLHGRISTSPARQYADISDWDGNSYCIKVRGIVEEGYLFGNKLRLEREISSVMGQNIIRLQDRVTNFGNKPSPFTILYHMNFGYPLLSEDAELIIEPSMTIPRDDDAIPGLKDIKRFIKPQPGFREQVYYHTMKGDNQGIAEVTLRNRTIKTSVTVKTNIKQLPYITQWKMMGQGEYVLGIEPCNVPCRSRKELREENILPFLQPGENSVFNLEIIVGSL
jgi:galactose mutarotase-like enzyme